METKNIQEKCIKQIRGIDYDRLKISDYNRTYINNILPNIEYSFSMYSHSISSLSTLTKDSLVVDFGGGHGFLSLFLKMLGYKTIYCDYNPLSAKTITLIKEQLGFGPDYIITGSTSELKQFCEEHQLTPTHLIATDLIEHVYDLSLFFHDLHEINPSFEMTFTTGSNPANSYKCKQLEKYMKEDEKEFVEQRATYIRNNYPQLSSDEVKRLTKQTRGKIYSDIKKEVDQYLQTGSYLSSLEDSYNTCDPATGNWTERILSFDTYKQLASKYGFKIEFAPGFYNEKRNNALISLLFQFINTFIRKGKRAAYSLAPYIVIKLHN